MVAGAARTSSDLEKPSLLPELHRSRMPGASVFIKGSIVSQDDLYLNGDIEGPVEAIRSTVTLGPSAKLTGSVTALKIIVLGSVQGPATALDTVELRKSCCFIGDIITARIVIEDGAYFKGSIDIRQTDKTSSSPETTQKPLLAKSATAR